MQKLKYQAGVTSENESMFEFNNVVVRILIIQENSFKNLDLHFGLSIEFRMILDDLECNLLFLFVIKWLKNLSKWPLTQWT